MKKINCLLLICILSFINIRGIFAQNVVTVQPKIMVIPFTKEGEDIRTVVEEDVNKRIVLTKIQEAFDSRGFNTVDFLAKVKAISNNAAFTQNNQSDLKSTIIESSSADIYVEAEIDIRNATDGNSVKIIVRGYDTATGNVLANKVGESGIYYTDDYGKLASKAIGTIADDFLNVLQTKFNDICKNGRSVMVNIGFDTTSSFTMHSKVGSQGLELADELELWMENNAFNGNYHIQGTTEKQMIFDDVRIPLKDLNTGNSYNANKFGLQLFNFFRSIGLQVIRDIKGQTIYITVK